VHEARPSREGNKAAFADGNRVLEDDAHENFRAAQALSDPSALVHSVSAWTVPSRLHTSEPEQTNAARPAHSGMEGPGEARTCWHARGRHGYSPCVRQCGGLRIARNGHPVRVCHGKVGLVIGISIAFAGTTAVPSVFQCMREGK
jgi:hypothetical protein